eukprot:SAG22_NODE_1842_length_3456_cov_3.666369_5_plen_168_part_00
MVRSFVGPSRRQHGTVRGAGGRHGRGQRSLYVGGCPDRRAAGSNAPRGTQQHEAQGRQAGGNARTSQALLEFRTVVHGPSSPVAPSGGVPPPGVQSGGICAVGRSKAQTRDSRQMAGTGADVPKGLAWSRAAPASAAGPCAARPAPCKPGSRAATVSSRPAAPCVMM